MLILVRDVGESIDIGNDVKMKVLRVTGTKVRLGFDCPDRSIQIHRTEVSDRIAAKEKRKA